MKRIFWIVLDSAGIGEAPDADKFGVVGSNTWKSCYDSGELHIPNMKKIGIYQIDGMEYAKSTENPTGSFAKMQELSCGKDTTTGHWEMAGIVTPDPLPKFPDGFPKVFIEEFSKRTGRKILCNLPYSGTQVSMLWPGAGRDRSTDRVYICGQCMPDCSARGDNSGRAVI